MRDKKSLYRILKNKSGYYQAQALVKLEIFGISIPFCQYYENILAQPSPDIEFVKKSLQSSMNRDKKLNTKYDNKWEKIYEYNDYSVT